MSRIGIKPIPIADGVTVTLSGHSISVEGPVGKLNWAFREEMTVEVNEADKQIVVRRPDDSRLMRSLHGMTRSIIANMVSGCAQGFTKALEVYGVGYGAQVQGRTLSITCGRSHPVALAIPDGLDVEVQTPQARGDTQPARFTIRGADKQAVGEFAARARRVRPPEPYKGKGVRYAGEYVRRKVGKAFAGGAA
ncbi:MAG: 50S ribosomal protein L6 [Phycisphaerae bacterium]|nr:50S ribosomal protein L6 [Phycisphaerae bacterium]